MVRPANLANHRNRVEVLAELHARPVEPVACPALVRRVAVSFDQSPDAADAITRNFADWCAQSGIAPPASDARYHRFDVGDRHVTWERHTEFVTLTWVSGPDDDVYWPDDIGLSAIAHGELVAATALEIASAASVTPSQLARYRPASLCFSEIETGEAQVATDFIADANGFTRFTVAASPAVDPQRTGVIVRRLLEIETYRTFALLGLPLARQVAPTLARLERQLGQLVEEMGNTGSEDDGKRRLAHLHTLTLQLNQTVERTSYRFSASRAYGEILSRRLQRLEERAGPGFSALERYLANRIEPALATCLAIEKRQTDLGQKLERVTEFLNTRIGLEVQLQNMQVMDRISKTSLSQYRLQRTVEGLSVIAISYYALGIVSYVLTGLGEVIHFSKPLVIAALAPAVVGLVWYGIRRLTRVHDTDLGRH